MKKRIVKKLRLKRGVKIAILIALMPLFYLLAGKMGSVDPVLGCGMWLLMGFDFLALASYDL